MSVAVGSKPSGFELVMLSSLRLEGRQEIALLRCGVVATDCGQDRRVFDPELGWCAGHPGSKVEDFRQLRSVAVLEARSPEILECAGDDHPCWSGSQHP